jgi:hypothetical protein
MRSYNLRLAFANQAILTRKFGLPDRISGFIYRIII